MFRIVPCTYQMTHLLAIVTLHYVPPVLMKAYPASPIQYVAKTQEPNSINFLFTYHRQYGGLAWSNIFYGTIRRQSAKSRM